MPARRVKRIAVLVESSRAFGRGLIEGIADFASERDDWLLYYHEGTLDFDLRGWLAHWRGDGILTRVARKSDAELLAASGIPTVDLLGEIRHPAIARVDTDNEAVARLAVQFFLDAGFTRLAFCGYPGIGFSDAREAMFETAAREEHLAIHRYRPPARPGNTIPQRELWRPRREEDLVAWLRSLPRPVAVFACNDVRALDVSVACRIAGLRVPEDVSLLGVDNDELICRMSRPPISSIEPDVRRHGRRGAEILHKMLGGKQKPRRPVRETIPPMGIAERPSTGLVAFSDPLIAAALRYLRKHGRESIGSQQVANHLGISNSHLNHRFKEATGRTIKQELQRIRLARIRHLLLHTDMSLREIARRSGFSSPANLSKFFKKKEGVPPGALREIYAQPTPR